MTLEPISLLKPRRAIIGMSAILLPFHEDGQIDWPSFAAHVQRTIDAGLIPAINMDTGFGNLIDEATKSHTLGVARAVVGCDQK